MPEVVDDAIEEGQDKLVPGIAGAAGYGLGSMVLGPGLGMPVGGVVAGSYIGGTEGTVITITGMALGFASLVFGSPNLGGGMTRAAGSGGSRGRM